MEHWLPFFHDRLETIFDYLPEASVMLDDQVTPAAWPAGKDRRPIRRAAEAMTRQGAARYGLQALSRRGFCIWTMPHGSAATAGHQGGAAFPLGQVAGAGSAGRIWPHRPQFRARASTGIHQPFRCLGGSCSSKLLKDRPGGHRLVVRRRAGTCGGAAGRSGLSRAPSRSRTSARCPRARASFS